MTVEEGVNSQNDDDRFAVVVRHDSRDSVIAASHDTARDTIAARIDALDVRRIGEELDAEGFAVIESVLSVEECAALSAGYERDQDFRSRVVMARHGSDGANTSISRIRFPMSSRNCAPRSIRL